MDHPNDGKLQFRTIWISDLHLGTAACQAAALLDFLRLVQVTHMTRLLRFIASLSARIRRAHALRRSSATRSPAIAELRSPPSAESTGSGWNAKLL